jgi:hypothetical protein
VGFAEDGTKIAWGNAVQDPGDYSGYYLNKGILAFELKLPKPGVSLGEPRALDTHSNFTKGIKYRDGVAVQAVTNRKAGVTDFKVSATGGKELAVSGGLQIIASLQKATSSSLADISQT